MQGEFFLEWELLSIYLTASSLVIRCSWSAVTISSFCFILCWPSFNSSWPCSNFSWPCSNFLILWLLSSVAILTVSSSDLIIDKSLLCWSSFSTIEPCCSAMVFILWFISSSNTVCSLAESYSGGTLLSFSLGFFFLIGLFVIGISCLAGMF